MKRPYQCLGIKAEAQSVVKGKHGWNEPVPELSEQTPGAAFLGELQFGAHPLPWVEAAGIRERLCAMPKVKALDLLEIWKQSIEKSSSHGGLR